MSKISNEAKDRAELIKAHQLAMAKNIARLSSRQSQKRQAHLLCQSLKLSIKVRGDHG